MLVLTSLPEKHGKYVSLADMALVSHVVGAPLFNVNLDKAPMLEAVADRCLDGCVCASASACPAGRSQKHILGS
jgi:hypothetical protein